MTGTDGARAEGQLAWVDVTAGVSGDMLLGAFVDAGASLLTIQAAVDAVLPDTVRLVAREVARAGLRAMKVDVELLVADQPHRTHAEIRDRLTEADLAEEVRRRALAVFAALASAEARVHGVSPDDVRFHEVGAWDSVADVVGVCAAVVSLGIRRVVLSPVSLGSGTVHGTHGELPVPVPAVLELARGWQVMAGGDGELATPTGIALVTTLAARQGSLPLVQVTASGVGAGSKDSSGRANVVRVVLGQTMATGEEVADGPGISTMTVLECNVDDLDPRVWPSVLESLLDLGAADAWLAPIIMKKGRPAHVLGVLAHDGDVDALRDAVLRLTTTIGVRETQVRRWALNRHWVDVDVDGQPVSVKIAHRGGQIVRATPELDAVAAAAAVLRAPVGDILDRTVAGAVRIGLTPGAGVPASARRTRARAGEPIGRQPSAGANSSD
jgi:uncharacterized protein (TIGR00299 family) protein